MKKKNGVDNLKFKDKRVLIVDGYARQTLAMSRGLKKLGVRVVVICYSKSDVGYASKYPDEKILFRCEKDDYGKQEEFVVEKIKNEKFDVVIPMTDHSATYLSRRKKELSEYSKIAVNDWDIFQMAIDKINTMKICADHGIPAPKTIFSTNPLQEIEAHGLDFPLVVKPRTAAGSIGFNIVYDKEQLVSLLSTYDNSNGPLLVQEYIHQNGPQYGAEVFRDNNGNIKACLIVKIPRWFPLDGGSRVLSVSIHDDKIKKACIDLLNALDWKGYANIDLVYDSIKNEPRILEINPRTGASIKIDFESGVDLSRLILENELGYEVTEMLEYPDNIQVSCFLVDFLWLIKCKDRFKIKPCWFNRWRIKDIVFSWRDPFPFFAFCVQSAKNYKKEIKKRERKD